MPRRKAAKNAVILPWLSAKADCKEGRFIQVGNSFLLAFGGKDQFVKLSSGARWMYLCMAMEAGGKSEVKFPHGAGKKYGIAGSSFDRYMKELKDSGFIDEVPDEELSQYGPRTYRFSLAWKSVKPAPHFGEGKP